MSTERFAKLQQHLESALGEFEGLLLLADNAKERRELKRLRGEIRAIKATFQACGNGLEGLHGRATRAGGE